MLQVATVVVALSIGDATIVFVDTTACQHGLCYRSSSNYGECKDTIVKNGL